MNLEHIAERVIKLAKKAGATAADATLAEGNECSVKVRLDAIENLKQSGSRGLGVRTWLGDQVGSAYTSDLTPEGLDQVVGQALDLARITSEDPFNALPDASDLGQLQGDLQLFDPQIPGIDTTVLLDLARRAERVARGADPRINNSDGGSGGLVYSTRVYANSLGFLGSYRTSSCSVSAVPVAQHDGKMERDYWYSSARHFAQLDPPEMVGRIAAERVLRRLGAQRVPTQKVPIVFDPLVARSLLGHLIECISGLAVYRQETFLHDQLHQPIASPLVNIVDDPTLPNHWGTSPFDDEGVLPRRLQVVEGGVLQTFLNNSYSARKLGQRTTGSASRGLSGGTGIGSGNFYLAPGPHHRDEVIRSVSQGLYVTELMGFGFNGVTGDYSRGAAGQWIERGELSYPVHEVTIAGNLKQMLMDIDMIANDLEFRSSVASPTLRIREMTVSGS